MTINKLQEVLQTKPFKPFIISLTDGRQFAVRSPEFIYIPPEASRTFIFATSEEDFSIIDLLLVTSLDFANGKARSRRS